MHIHSLFLARPIVSYCLVHFQKKQTLMVPAVVMILRVWAMYNRSRLILGTLLTSGDHFQHPTCYHHQPSEESLGYVDVGRINNVLH